MDINWLDLILAIITIIALIVAVWQLSLQRQDIMRNSREVEKNSKINSLEHLSRMLQVQIDRQQKMIDDFVLQNKNCTGLKKNLHGKLRPALNEVNAELFKIIKDETDSLDYGYLEALLKFNKKTGA